MRLIRPIADTPALPLVAKTLPKVRRFAVEWC